MSFLKKMTGQSYGCAGEKALARRRLKTAPLGPNASRNYAKSPFQYKYEETQLHHSQRECCIGRQQWTLHCRHIDSRLDKRDPPCQPLFFWWHARSGAFCARRESDEQFEGHRKVLRKHARIYSVQKPRSK
jgi:hypothetical protein